MSSPAEPRLLRVARKPGERRRKRGLDHRFSWLAVPLPERETHVCALAEVVHRKRFGPLEMIGVRFEQMSEGDRALLDDYLAERDRLSFGARHAQLVGLGDLGPLGIDELGEHAQLEHAGEGGGDVLGEHEVVGRALDEDAGLGGVALGVGDGGLVEVELLQHLAERHGPALEVRVEALDHPQEQGGVVHRRLGGEQCGRGVERARRGVFRAAAGLSCMAPRRRRKR